MTLSSVLATETRPEGTAGCVGCTHAVWLTGPLREILGCLCFVYFGSSRDSALSLMHMRHVLHLWATAPPLRHLYLWSSWNRQQATFMVIFPWVRIQSGQIGNHCDKIQAYFPNFQRSYAGWAPWPQVTLLSSLASVYSSENRTGYTYDSGSLVVKCVPQSTDERLSDGSP